MFRLPRPNSTIFRPTLALALLAWTVLAFGASPMGEANRAAAASSHVQMAKAAAMHCHDTMTVAAVSHGASVPMTPAGHGDCCRTACHCLVAPAAIMTVPWVFVAVVLPGEQESRAPNAPVPPATAAPPLRPPIA